MLTLLYYNNIITLCYTILVKIYHSIVLLLIQIIYLLNRTFKLILDQLSLTAVNFIRSENNPALLKLFMLLGLSEHML